MGLFPVLNSPAIKMITSRTLDKLGLWPHGQKHHRLRLTPVGVGGRETIVLPPTNFESSP